MAGGIPSPDPAGSGTGGTEAGNSGNITPSNKSSQTPQANSQNYPLTYPDRAGKGIVSSKGKTVVNGKFGRSF